MTPYEALEDARARMHQESEALEGDLVAVAEAEAAYYASKGKRALELKSQGMSATMVEMIIKGDDEVNLHLLEWRCAEARAKATQEAINVHKLDARLLEAQIARDWSLAE